MPLGRLWEGSNSCGRSQVVDHPYLEVAICHNCSSCYYLLSPCVKLTKLNLSKNSIESMGGLGMGVVSYINPDFPRGENPCDIVTSGIKHSPLVAVCCKTLTWLDLSHNQLDSLVGIQALTNLAGEQLILCSGFITGW